MKKVLFFLLTLLAASSVMAQDVVKTRVPSEMTNSEYIRLSRSQIYGATEKKLNKDYKVEIFKKGMTAKELRRRNRYISYQVAAKIIEEANSSIGFEGLLVNYKSLPVQFNITRTDIKGTARVSHLVAAEKEFVISLLPGTYQVELVCGNERVSYPLEVRPGEVNSCEAKKVYWYAYCNRY